MTIYKCDLMGTIATNDIWQAGFYVQSDADVDQVGTLVAGSADNMMSNRFPTNSKITKVRTSELVEASGDIVAVAEYDVTGATGITGSALPANCAVCVTIRPVTGLITGRFYLPAPSVGAVDVNGLLTSTYRTDLATALQTFFQTDLGGASSPARLGVYSRKNHQYIGASRIEVGSVVDSQRRRRNKLIEARTSLSVL